MPNCRKISDSLVTERQVKLQEKKKEKGKNRKGWGKKE